MKSLFKMLALLMLAVSLLTCTQEEDVKPVNVQFTFDLKSPDDGGGRTSSFDLPEGMSLLVSIEKSSGEVVFTHHKINLLSVGGRYITEPLLLNPGTYRLTDFMLVNESSQVLYATPRKGSPLAGAVGNPLPHVFIVSKNNSSELEMGVVDVTHSAPEEFGYTTFDIEIITPLRVGVFVDEDDELSLTGAQAHILDFKDGYFDTLHSFTLDAKINTLGLTADLDREVYFVVTKDTYRLYYYTGTLRDLVDGADNQPLSIVLEPVITVQAHNVDNSQIYSLNFEFEPNYIGPWLISADWGDNVPFAITSYSIESNDTSRMIFNFYLNSEPHDYTATISGRLSKIVTFSIAPNEYGPNATTAIDIRHLPGLKTLSITNTTGPRTIDLSKNLKLSRLILTDTDIETLDISANTKLKTLYLDYCPNMTSDGIDNIIETLYDNVVARDIFNGTLSLHKGHGAEEQYFTGNPSAASIEKLRSLKHDYHWTVIPNPD